MAIKDLAVAYDGSPAAHSALEFSVQLAKKCDAAITGILANPPTEFAQDFSRWVAPEVLKNVEERVRQGLTKFEDEFRTRLASLDFAGPSSWVTVEGNPGIALSRTGRFHDILVTGQFARAFRREQGALQPEELIHNIGRPLIIVPEGFKARELTETAAIAWDGSRSAARALSDAMQILETKRKIDVLVVEGKKSHDDPYAPLPAAKIISHLEKHGVSATEVRLDPVGRSSAKAVLKHCEETDPDVLVMGAFGRGKLGAMLFGSMTTNVLASMNVPVLVSH